ncbi:branched-chain amino acid ABC transporter permease [Pelagibacterium halotolerans]|uniref:ABC-type branched-chain amino acid transport system, permeasecomponent n=1 Tax=Pelagibacterium halotolerans (strain DSM 22347 / JCM 15775 / CGMCC 1.7692 / B2) TaxID=1082931 RepID=G4RAZ5_PELHB|nr:branched-chain amino acid ABC transporter permease [Pelagibacterium halotolerans]AEQ53631.1 ABC-type branched-chain amino acid transport system, permeasecomponent [Pelagibacterium halotolerans B2]QJR20195.1 branched-chain amino acid ABC transporter permease [Pelagibacterium halotolerans]SEA91249.1 amino acid/amide ABC transporter membrane protein 2, HAAT family [Pelagibacterium halotolerans]
MTSSSDNVASVRAARKAHDAGMTTHRDIRRAYWFPIAILLALSVLPALQFAGNYNYLLHLVLLTASYAAMAAGWNILGGFTGYISLGHNVFFAIGGYFAGMLMARYGISAILLAPAAGVVAGLFGYVIGLITLRVRGPSFIISSLALVMIARILMDNWHFIGGANGVPLPPTNLPVQWAKLPYYYAFIALAAFAVWLNYRIKHSKFGLGLRAIAKDEIKAESAGIDTRLYKVLAFAISAGLVGMAGAIWGEYLTYIRPNIFLMILVSVNMVLMCILGGKGTVAGPVIGAILIVAFNELFVATLGASEINILATGLIMALTLIFFPLGIVGTLALHRRLPRILNWD